MFKDKPCYSYFLDYCMNSVNSMTDHSPLVLTEVIEKNIAVVTLNNPGNLNALSTAMRHSLANAFAELVENESIRVVILTGAGRAFTAGLDLKELGQKGFSSEISVPGRELDSLISSLNKPLIGAINGFAITGGFELALMCDILVASEKASFADTHVRMGVVPGWGLTQRLSRLIGASRAKEMSFSGNFIDAVTAERWGLVNRVLPPDELMPACIQLARDICSAQPETLQSVRSLINFGIEHGLAEGLIEEKRQSKFHQNRLNPDYLEERRKEVQERGRAQKISGMTTIEKTSSDGEKK